MKVEEEKLGVVKLNLGAGKLPLKGYVNIDIRSVPFIDVVHDIRKMKELYQDNSIDEIMAGDVLEHLELTHWKKALNDWVDLLKPGGVLKLRTIDIKKMIDYFNLFTSPEGYDPRENWDKFVHYLYGDQDYLENTHNCGFTEEYLADDLEDMGMRIEKIWHDGGYLLRVTAIKGEEEPLTCLDHNDYPSAGLILTK